MEIIAWWLSMCVMCMINIITINLPTLRMETHIVLTLKVGGMKKQPQTSYQPRPAWLWVQYVFCWNFLWTELHIVTMNVTTCIDNEPWKFRQETLSGCGPSAHSAAPSSLQITNHTLFTTHYLLVAHSGHSSPTLAGMIRQSCCSDFPPRWCFYVLCRGILFTLE